MSSMDYCVGTVQIRFVYVRITPWVPGGSPGKNSHGVPTYFSGIFHGNPRVIPSFLLGSRGNPAQMTNLQTQLRVSRMEDKRYTMHSIRVGGVTSHGMDGTAMDVLMEYVSSRETTFLDADALPLPEQLACSYAAFPRNNRRRGH